MVISPQMRHTIFFMGRKQWQTCPSSAPPPFNIAVLPFLAFSRRIVRLDSGGGMQDLEEGGGAKGLLSGCPGLTPIFPPSLLAESMSSILATKIILINLNLKFVVFGELARFARKMLKL